MNLNPTFSIDLLPIYGFGVQYDLSFIQNNAEASTQTKSSEFSLYINFKKFLYNEDLNNLQKQVLDLEKVRNNYITSKNQIYNQIYQLFLNYLQSFVNYHNYIKQISSNLNELEGIQINHGKDSYEYKSAKNQIVNLENQKMQSLENLNYYETLFYNKTGIEISKIKEIQSIKSLTNQQSRTELYKNILTLFNEKEYDVLGELEIKSYNEFKSFISNNPEIIKIKLEQQKNDIEIKEATFNWLPDFITNVGYNIDHTGLNQNYFFFSFSFNFNLTNIFTLNLNIEQKKISEKSTNIDLEEKYKELYENYLSITKSIKSLKRNLESNYEYINILKQQVQTYKKYLKNGITTQKQLNEVSNDYTFKMIEFINIHYQLLNQINNYFNLFCKGVYNENK